jgi:hypothetical protein
MIMRLARRGAFGGICRVFVCALRHYLAVLLRPTGITADSGQLRGGGGRFGTVAVICEFPGEESQRFLRA